MTTEIPATLGGSPLFSEPLGIVRPLIPPLDAIRDRLEQAMITGQLTNNGQHVRQLERRLANHFRVQHVICVANGTSGLMILCRALGTTGEIIVPSFTFSATAHAAVWAGLSPVFADILPDTFTIDPASVAKLINERTVAVMGVHVYGHPCEIDELQSLGEKRHVPVIFDAAHAFGSRYRDRLVGSFGRAEMFSFHATKVFPVGEGGAITTDDGDLAERVRLLRTFGDPGTEITQVPGLNAKMQEFNALLGLENLAIVNRHIANRREVGQTLRDELSSVPGLVFQAVRNSCDPNFQNFVLLVDPRGFGMSRDQLCAALKTENVICRKYFYPPLHRHSVFEGKSAHTPIDLPNTELIAARVLCLPIYSDMEVRTAQRLAQAIRRIQRYASEVLECLQGGDGIRTHGRES
jgi:dTDP-4-amino-4,6-dideoxygalactose transaminase